MKEYLNANEKVQYAIFRSDIKSWDSLFTLAAEFATKVGREKLINISHSESRGEGVVTVWYWVL